jgi:hypothetical protein
VFGWAVTFEKAVVGCGLWKIVVGKLLWEKRKTVWWSRCDFWETPKADPTCHLQSTPSNTHLSHWLAGPTGIFFFLSHRVRAPWRRSPSPPTREADDGAPPPIPREANGGRLACARPRGQWRRARIAVMDCRDRAAPALCSREPAGMGPPHTSDFLLL